MKWIGIALCAVFVCAAAYAVYIKTVVNPRVTEDLRFSPQGTRAQRVMLITLPSGKTLPVNYLREGDVVYAGADGPWWRELRGGGANVGVVVLGEALRGHAISIENDPVRTQDIFSRLRPDVPAWLPDFLSGVLVAIELDE